MAMRLQPTESHGTDVAWSMDVDGDIHIVSKESVAGDIYLNSKDILKMAEAVTQRKWQ